jgi:hypothetical protein
VVTPPDTTGGVRRYLEWLELELPIDGYYTLRLTHGGSITAIRRINRFPEKIPYQQNSRRAGGVNK